MKVLDLSKNVVLPKLGNTAGDSLYFIVATQEEFSTLYQTLNIDMPPQSIYANIDENIRFECHPNYDYLSFVYFDLKGIDFIFEVFNLYYAKNFLALVVEQDDGPHNALVEEFTIESLKNRTAGENLTYIYYKFLNNAFTKMFDSMCVFENELSTIEDGILTAQENFDLEKIVEVKSNSFEIKKCLRLLLYVGDQLLVNDNGLIPENDMRFFRNIDMRINRMYEFASDIHEAGEHLMEMYNSAVNAKTNDLINKLTVFTVFVTPITVLTGLYGMNFVNMPELQHEYGYFIFLGVSAAILGITYYVLKKIKLL